MCEIDNEDCGDLMAGDDTRRGGYTHVVFQGQLTFDTTTE